MLSLYDQMKHYIDPKTGMLPAPDGGRDNLVLDTVYLYRQIESGTTERILVLSSILNFLFATNLGMGLYSREHGNFDQNSVDNLIATAYISRSAAEEILGRWYVYGATYQTSEPWANNFGRAWFGRFIGLKAYLKVCAGLKPWFFERWAWCLAALWSTYTSSGASNPLLQSLQNDVMKYQGFLCRKTVGLWEKHYSVSKLLSDYFPSYPLGGKL